MSDMKCPFCGAEIKIAGERTTIMSCFNGECYGSGLYGEEAMWQVLIQVKQDLEIATKALEEISSHYQDEMGKPTFVDWYLSAKKMCDCADKALETIGKHKE